MRIVECAFNDSADYEFIHDSAVSNTFKKYFEWSEEHNIPVEFHKKFVDDLIHGLMIIIDAKFKHSEDEAQFKLTFENKVYNTIKSLPIKTPRVTGNELEFEFGYK